jgi:polyribonucleotide nucleotidyltransferase
MKSYPTYENTYHHDIKVGDKNIHVEIGKFSEQVAAAVLTTCGETVVLTTVALGRKVDLGYFPLSVEFQEKLYAGGIIKGSRWVKRDGRPTDEAVLKARVIDRTLRPLFPDGVTNEVQVISTVFSYDGENDADMLGLIGAGIGLQISEIPFHGPVAGVRVGYNKNTETFIYNPTEAEGKESDLDLIVSGTGETIVMVEAGANEISEEIMIKALDNAQKVLGEVSKEINAIAKEIGKDKIELVTPVDPAIEAATDELKKNIYAKHKAEIKEIVIHQGKLEPTGMDEFIVALEAEFGNADEEAPVIKIDAKFLKGVVYDLLKQEARRMILEDKERPDGRKPDEIRQIWTELDLFPRTHGSAMFKRGATQVVTITTLGSPALAQYIEDMAGEAVRHYMHFYNMPPFASGEAGRVGYPKRREVGHGALAERALAPMIPDQATFPYTIQVVSEVVSSNGSTSQASVCGSTLSLMAAGVPIKRPVAGIAMGLMSDEKGKYVVLSDIQGLEDHVGDMDFKVAGTSEGITAIQMDIKLTGLNMSILHEALEQARKGRMHIMGEMLKGISEPRKQLSALAPKIEQVTIPMDRIGELIGPGGKVIKNIIALSGAQVDVSEDPERELGLINISSADQAAIDKARQMVENIMYVATAGDEFDGTVTRVEGYGAFVEYLPGREGLVHVSEMAAEYTADANDRVKVGDKVHIWVSGMKDDGKVSLSMMSPEDREQARANAPERPAFRGGDRNGGDRRGGGGYGGDRRGGGSRGGYGGGDRNRGGRDNR